MIISGGSVFHIKTVQTLVLDLGVSTELTEDDFYDNGNLANNVAALLGIDPSKIRVMNVISESSARRRKRMAEEGGWMVHGRARRADTNKSLQFEITPEVEGNAGAEALDEVAKGVIDDPGALANTVADVVIEDDPSFVADESVAVAAPPKKKPPPEPPVTLAEKLGVEEIMPGDDLEAFIDKLSAAAGLDVTTLETAEEKAQKVQEEEDRAAELITYDTPTTMILDESSVPTGPQLLGQRMFEAISLSMLNQNGEHMELVGYVEDPYQVKAEIYEPVLTGDDGWASLDGTTVVPFKPGNGYAVFDNLVINGVMSSCKIKFSVSKPRDNTIDHVITTEIEFMPATPPGECEIKEGEGFDRKISMSETCDFVCLSSCVDLGGLGDAAAPKCKTMERCEGTSGDPTFATCSDGACACDMDTLPDVRNLRPADFMSYSCSAGVFEARVNKCVMNKFDLMLKDLYIAGPEKPSNFSETTDAVTASCRGALDFNMGPEYIFRVDRSVHDCNTDVNVNADGSITYKNGLTAYKTIADGEITKAWKAFMDYECTFELDLSASANINSGNAQKTSVTKDSGVAITVGVYDETFTKILKRDQITNVPDIIRVGAVVTSDTNAGLEVENCWVSPTEDKAAGTVRYDVIVGESATVS